MQKCALNEFSKTMATPTPKVTCLLTLLRACSEDEREQLAALAGTKVNYLYSVAGCSRAQMRVGLAFAIEDASEHLHKKTNGRVPKITARDLATMCSTVGLAG